MFPPPASHRLGPTKTLSSGLVSVVFSWQDDRWIHSLHRLGADGRSGPSCWQTAPVSSDVDPEWPSSPPLVELADIPSPQGAAIVGVGKAGKSHYSASIIAEPGGGLRFEMACRLGAEPRWLGSAYTFTGVTGSSPLVIEPLEGMLADFGAEQRLEIVPRAADDSTRGSAQKGTTLQWSYRVRAIEQG